MAIEKVSCSAYLIIRNTSRSKMYPQIKVEGVRANKPNLTGQERAIKITLRLPKSYFIEGFPEATIEIPEGAFLEPEVEVEMPDGEE